MLITITIQKGELEKCSAALLDDNFSKDDFYRVFDVWKEDFYHKLFKSNAMESE